jgi:hypothetical protein
MKKESVCVVFLKEKRDVPLENALRDEKDEAKAHTHHKEPVDGEGSIPNSNRDHSHHGDNDLKDGIPPARYRERISIDFGDSSSTWEERNEPPRDLAVVLLHEATMNVISALVLEATNDLLAVVKDSVHEDTGHGGEVELCKGKTVSEGQMQEK